MRHRRASRLVLVAWLATAVLLGSACSSDDDATPNATATTTSEPADPAGPSTTAGPGAASIAEVDFRNFTYEYPGVGPDDELSEVTVTDGEFSEGEQPGDSFYFEVVDVDLADDVAADDFLHPAAKLVADVDCLDCHRSAPRLLGVDLVEHPAVGKVLLLRRLPAAEVLDGDQLDFREAGDVGRVGVFGPDRAVVVLGGEFLPDRRVQVLEVGLGGRLDATNVIDAPVSVVTPIGLDHQHFLGDTIELIATEKAGIIKPDAITVMAVQPEPDAVDVLGARAAEVGARLVAEGVDIGVTARDVAFGGGNFRSAKNNPSVTSNDRKGSVGDV